MTIPMTIPMTLRERLQAAWTAFKQTHKADPRAFAIAMAMRRVRAKDAARALTVERDRMFVLDCLDTGVPYGDVARLVAIIETLPPDAQDDILMALCRREPALVLHPVVEDWAHRNRSRLATK